MMTVAATTNVTAMRTVMVMVVMMTMTDADAYLIMTTVMAMVGM